MAIHLQSTAHFLQVSNPSAKKQCHHTFKIFLSPRFHLHRVSLTQVAFWEGLSQPERVVSHHGSKSRLFFCTSGSQRELCKGAVS